jgi:tetratricopeptide (TPR) repeat protein
MKQNGLCKTIFFALALSILLSACAKPPDPPPAWQEQYDLGMRYLSEGNYQEAIVAFTAAIEIDPKQAIIYVGRGDAYIKLDEQIDLALADYETALNLDETSADAYLGIADVYIRRLELNKADEILALGLEKTGDERILSKLEELRNGDSVTDSDGKTRVDRYYDPEGNLQVYMLNFGVQSDGKDRSEEYGAGGELQGVHISYESDDGLTTYGERYEADGRLSSRSVRVCDADGKWLYSTSTDETGNNEYLNEAVYDEQGNYLGWDTYLNGALNGWARDEGGKTVYYDASGNMTGYAE